MDKFEQLLKDLPKMPADEQMKAVNNLKAMCICPTCPTHTNCAKNANEIFFCWNGKSFMCIDSEKDCFCPKCPVTKEVGLKYKFFCTRGAEKAQRYEHTLWGSTLVR
jgi:hypothetical protein